MIPWTINLFLWVITLWIPYLNVGTTIGLLSLPAKMAKDGSISMTEIFDSSYRGRMGEFFLTYLLSQQGILVGILFFIIPGIVIAIGWSLSLLLVVDKGLNPLEAMNESSRLTHGKKGTIFFGLLLLSLIAVVLLGVLAAILFGFMGGLQNAGALIALSVVGFVLMMAYSSVLVAGQAVIYKNLAT